jgi:hypothetical protein
VVDADMYQLTVIVVADCVFDRHEATDAMNLSTCNENLQRS